MGKEIWKDVPGLEGVYIVSIEGACIRLETFCKSGNNKFRKVQQKQVPPQLTREGYLEYRFNHNKMSSRLSMHRLLAILFIPNPNNYPIINHKNGDKTDNRIENLEWCTQKMNLQHSWDIGLNKGRRGRKYPKEKFSRVLSPVDYYDKNGEYIKSFDSMCEASKELGIRQSAISQSANGMVKKARKYIFKLKEA